MNADAVIARNLLGQQAFAMNFHSGRLKVYYLNLNKVSFTSESYRIRPQTHSK